MSAKAFAVVLVLMMGIAPSPWPAANLASAADETTTAEEASVPQTAASSQEAHPISASPEDVGAKLRESDGRPKSLTSFAPETWLHDLWEQNVTSLREPYGLDFGLNYTLLYQHASESEGKDAAFSGDLDFFGSWAVWDGDGRLPGSVVFSTEWRHKFTDKAPSELGKEIGSLWGTTVSFNVQEFSIVQLYWDQGSFEDRFRYRFGKMDPALLYDGGRYVSANFAFLSPAFSDTLPMPLPGAGLGAVAAVYPYGETYIMLGTHDANGERTTAGVNSLRRGEFFTALELGVTPRYGQVGEGLYHVTFWHSDERTKARVPSGRGIALTAEQELGAEGNIVPFLRYAYADDDVTPVKRLLAGGLGLEGGFGPRDDLVGVAVAWGEPSNTALHDQYVAEAFYLLQLTPYTHFTADLQWIIDPSDAPDRDAIWVGSLRLRTLF